IDDFCVQIELPMMERKSALESARSEQKNIRNQISEWTELLFQLQQYREQKLSEAQHAEYKKSKASEEISSIALIDTSSDAASILTTMGDAGNTDSVRAIYADKKRLYDAEAQARLGLVHSKLEAARDNLSKAKALHSTDHGAVPLD